MNLNKVLSPNFRVKSALALLIIATIAWPITAFTVFKDEPQGILGLSYLAIILTALDILSTQEVKGDTME